MAQKAARQAADGEWQAAYDTAAESLRLARQDNDLAAFVVIVASLAGAHRSVSSVPRPRAEALPPSLAPLLDETLEVAQRLRSMGEESASAAEIETVLRELDPQHRLLPPPAPLPVEAPVVPPQPQRFPWRLMTAAAGVALLIGALTGSWTGQQTTQQKLGPRIAELEKRLQTTPEPPAVPIQAAQAQSREPLLRQVQTTLSLEAYRHGLKASQREEYKEARQYLEFAVQGPRDSYYWDDSLYYLARAYHRLHEREKAAAAYRRLEREAPGSVYLKDTRQFLARLEQGQEVER